MSISSIEICAGAGAGAGAGGQALGLEQAGYGGVTLIEIEVPTWIAVDKTVIGHEIRFKQCFYQRKPIRSLGALMQEISALKAETDSFLKQLVSFVGVTI